MGIKRGLINFIIIFTFVILSISLISAAKCVLTTTNCADANRVMKLSSATNAHGALYNQGTYTYYLCCDFTGVHTCSGTNEVLGLSSSTNAHAELNTQKIYESNPVCFGNLTCDFDTSCDLDQIAMLSISGTTNAHIGNVSNYPTKICCNPNLAYCGDGTCNGAETCATCPGDCSCNDNNLCTTDTCSSGVCSNTPKNCADSTICTTDSCNPLTGTCVHTPTNINLGCESDGNACTNDSCNALGVCVNTILIGRACSADGNACTVDQCGADGKCYARITSCTNNDGCCAPGCTYLNDNNCPRCTVANQTVAL